MVELFVGAGLGFLYVEVLYKLIRRSIFLALFSYPLRTSVFAVIMAMLVLEGSLADTIFLVGGFLFGFLLNTFLRGFGRLGNFKLS